MGVLGGAIGSRETPDDSEEMGKNGVVSKNEISAETKYCPEKGS